MPAEEIKGEDYVVYCKTGSTIICFKGELSLGGPSDYAPIAQLLEDVASKSPPTMTLDLTQLEFLNSSGINMISKFIIGLRKKPPVQILVIGSTDIPWQGKSLKNLKKLLPTLELKLV